ncbi:hypothetical protein LDENG_00117980 [Scomber scombrus]|uniref:Uncharacterized protein n=1 Tax=Scomber scombrus TaxID=13677 RepID=A0AAV1NN53_SCOSC
MDLTAYGTHRHPDCALLSSFLEVKTKEKRGNRKKGPGSECRDGPPDFAAAGRGCLDSKGSGIVTKQPFTLRGALYCSVFRVVKASGQQLLENELIFMEILKRNG